MSHPPDDWLWAWFEGKFYFLAFEPKNRHLDHVRWFAEIGLPDFGPDFDRVLRGRLLWDHNFDYYVLTYYGMDSLPNLIYDLVVKHLNPDMVKMIEKPVSTEWM